MKFIMSDWDVNLIREFAMQPIIYNKATPFFKNKYLTDCAWDEIAAKVGCDVNRVRDRINQLRNRYNLEKRKVDIQKSEGYIVARSTWPLFDNLRFLDGHIRPRKSYKCLGITRRSRPPGRPRRPQNYTSYGDESQSQPPVQYANPVAMQYQGVQIKYEPNETDNGVASNASRDGSGGGGVDSNGRNGGGSNHDATMYHSGYETDDDGRCRRNSSEQKNGHRSNDTDGEHFINPATFLVEDDDSGSERVEPQQNGQENNNQSQSSPHTETVQHSPGVTLRNINALKDHPSSGMNGDGDGGGGDISRINNNISSNRHIDCESRSSLHHPSSFHPKYYRSPIAKFEAFGNFVVSALTDLPEPKALELVEKFTSDLVRALITSKSGEC